MFTGNYVVSIFLVILCHFCTTHGSITCKDQNAETVDWFIVYKLPRLELDPNPLIRDGFGYYYMDVNAPYWKLGDVSLNTTGHAISHTLQQVYDNYKSKDVLYLLYNDETPEKNVSFRHGHTKGDVCFDKTSGFWLVHSLPRFPNYARLAYEYPHSGRVYGQTFLCVTYNYHSLDLIGKQMLYTYPQVYDYNLPASFHDDNPNIVATVKKKHVRSSPWKRMVTLSSHGGEKFTSFAKFTKFDADLYHDWLAPYYHSNVYVESWLNGRGSMDSNCSAPYKAFNIRELVVSKTSFNVTHDHSKWAVTETGQWTCIGDINRQVSQLRRAGGTVCFHITDVWRSFNQSIHTYQPCPHLYPDRPRVLQLNQVGWGGNK